MLLQMLCSNWTGLALILALVLIAGFAIDSDREPTKIEMTSIYSLLLLLAAWIVGAIRRS